MSNVKHKEAELTMRYRSITKRLPGGHRWRAPCWVPVAMLLLALWSPAPAAAQEASWWETRVAAYGGRIGPIIGAWPGRVDGYDGGGGLDPRPEEVGIFLLSHRENGPDWNGPTGFYAEDYESPIPPGGSKTWPAFYLWSQNYTPSPPNQVQVRTVFGMDLQPPDGYRGHLVLDQIPASAGWTGPTDFWLDLTVFNTFTLPIATVTDPLQGTRFHLTVYAIPEPPSLALLGLATLGLAARAIRRRR